ncbi:hypothetical protein LSM04_001235 [Trypanosoma melophagium]|uniref:uncharacterized protein n=1 Tax=Trypanosoma melophagium TaxID=715481 RepID=UPI00351A58C3|nr:hypothetical protein LSM04_001235 [Trypanosoma melophagium]
MASVRQTLGGSFNTRLSPSQQQQGRYREQYQYQQQEPQQEQEPHYQHQYQQYREQRQQQETGEGSLYHPNRLPRVGVVEMEIPVVMANFPRGSRTGIANDNNTLPIVERGTTPGVPFDLCSLSTVGSHSVGSASTHRRFKKYTTTTITTTTVTKIVLPHMSQVISSDVSNPMHPQNILMAIEDKKSGDDRKLGNSNALESSQVRNGDGHVYPRKDEQQQERPEWDTNNAPVSDGIPLKASRHPRQNSSNPNSSNSPQTSDASNGRNGSFTSGELLPHTESSPPQQQQQPWVFNHQTVSKTTSVSRHLPPVSGTHKKEKRDLSVNGTAIPLRDEQARHNRQEGYGEPHDTNTPSHSQCLHSMPNSAANEKISENLRQPWILNEEKTQREWYTVE